MERNTRQVHPVVRRRGDSDAGSPPSLYSAGTPYTVGLMFWFRRNKFVGSYVFFSAANRSYFPP
jgi:hypothetical protein